MQAYTSQQNQEAGDRETSEVLKTEEDEVFKFH